MATPDIDSILRDNTVLGDTGSPVHNPIKSGLRQYLKWMERLKTEGSVAAKSFAELDAIPVGSADRWGVVRGASTKTENGYYFGDSALDTWTKVSDLGLAVAEGINIAGTGNDITGDLSGDATAADAKIIYFVPAATNAAGPVSVTWDAGDLEAIKSASGADPAAGDLQAGIATLLFDVAGEWRLFGGGQGAGFDFQGAWSNATTYTQGQTVTKSNKLYFLDAASSLNEDPDSGAPWVEMFDVSSIATEGWTLSQSGLTSLIEFDGPGAVLRAATPGTDKSLYIGVDDVPTSNISPNIWAYAIDHATHPGEAGVAAVTAIIPGKGRAAHYNVESGFTCRDKSTFGTRHSLTPGPNDINSIPSADAPVHILVPTGTLGVPPYIAGVGANSTYNPGLVIEANVSGGGQFSEQMIGGTNHVFHSIKANPGSSLRFMETWDHQNGIVKHQSGGNMKLAYTNSDVFLGKTARDASAVGVEFRDAQAQCYMTVANTYALQLMRNGSFGTVMQLGIDGVVHGSLSVASDGTMNLNSFHGSHWSQLSDHSMPDFLPGTVCETIDDMCHWLALEYDDPVHVDEIDGVLVPRKIITEDCPADIDLAALGEGAEVSIDVERTVEEIFRQTIIEEEPVLEDKEHETPAFDHEEVDGKLMRRKVMRRGRRQVIDLLPVIDEETGEQAVTRVPDRQAPGGFREVPEMIGKPRFKERKRRHKIRQRVPKVFTVTAKVVRMDDTRLVKFRPCDTVGSKRVLGFFHNQDQPDDPRDVDAQVFALGAGVGRIAAGETVEGGDLLESAGGGCARKIRLRKDDNPITVAERVIGKVSAAIAVKTYDDGSYLVPVER